MPVLGAAVLAPSRATARLDLPAALRRDEREDVWAPEPGAPQLPGPVRPASIEPARSVLADLLDRVERLETPR